MIEKQVDTKRVLIFIAFAFGIAWAVSLVIYLTGGLVNSPKLGGTQITLALVLEATAYMGAPALAHVLTRLVTKEGWKELYLRPNFRKNQKYWLAGWVGPAILTVVGMLVFFILFPKYFDPTLGRIQAMLRSSSAAAGQPLPSINPWLIVLAQFVQGLLLSPILNSVATFGEEFGWRAYLQPRLMPLGGKKAMLLMGLIWGVWHWPLIAMGHNYGLNYPGYPWLGLLGMVGFTLLTGTFLGWMALRSGSVWPAVIGHAAMNGIGALALLLVKGEPNMLIGPAPVGIVGSAGFLIVFLLIFFNRNALSLPENKAQISSPIAIDMETS